MHRAGFQRTNKYNPHPPSHYEQKLDELEPVVLRLFINFDFRRSFLKLFTKFLTLFGGLSRDEGVLSESVSL